MLCNHKDSLQSFKLRTGPHQSRREYEYSWLLLSSPLLSQPFGHTSFLYVRCSLLFFLLRLDPAALIAVSLNRVLQDVAFEKGSRAAKGSDDSVDTPIDIFRFPI
jgi:hypothetical protein